MATPAEIQAYVAKIMNDPSLSGVQKTNMIADAATKHGVTADQLAQHSGGLLSLDQINRNLATVGRTLPTATSPATQGLTAQQMQYLVDQGGLQQSAMTPMQQAVATPGALPVANTTVSPEILQAGLPAPVPQASAPPVSSAAAPPPPVQQQAPQPTIAANTAAPAPAPAQAQPFGLAGAEQAMTLGGLLGTNQLQQTMADIRGLFSEGIEGLRPFITTGTQANDRQAALSGALGADAQSEAMAGYESSPLVQQARQQAERAILQNASATGSLGSGNTLDQLYQNAAGMFLDDFNNQFMRLGEVSNRGFSGASQGAGLAGQEAGVQAGLGSQAAQIPVGLGSQMGGFRYQAGRDIADQISGVNAGIAGLTEQQGRGLSDIVGNATNNVQNLLQGAYGGDQQSRQQLMMLLSNLASQQGSQIAGQPIIPGFQSNYVGQLGQIASGIGGMAYGLGATGMNADPVVTGSGSGFNTVPGYGPSYAGSYNPMFSLGMG